MIRSLSRARAQTMRLPAAARPSEPSPRFRVALLLSGIAGVLLAIAFLAPIAVAAGEESAVASEGKSLSSAPDFSCMALDGKTYRLSDLLKKGPVLLDFWTTWCKPCMMELPHLQKIWELHKDEGFTLVGVASDEQKTAAKIKPTAQSKGFKFLILTDGDRKVGNLFNVRNYPTTILIKQDGSIASVTQGYRPGDEKEMEAKIMALLKGSAAPGGEH